MLFKEVLAYGMAEDEGGFAMATTGLLICYMR